MLNSKVLTERIDKWLSPIYWTSSNIRSALYGDIAQPLAVYVYQPENRDKPSIQEALSRFVDIRRSTEALVKVHDSFGPSWTTKWFQIIFQIPSSMKGRCTAFRWNSSSEAMLYSSAGICLQSFTGGDGSNCRDLYILPSSDVNEQGELVFYVEMVCNDLFGNGNNGMIFPPDDNKYYSISKAELVVVNRPAHALFWDVKVMLDMVTELKMESPEAARALGLLTQVINTTDVTNEASIDAAHDLISRTFFNSVDDCKVPHDVYALGHCHIDTAWLWSYAETRRKVLRSWSTQLRLLNDYRFQFVASQTVHFEWLKEDNLALYDRVKESIRLRRFLPVGGSYVEFDANMPSGESMIRQLLYGMRFTEQEFKVRPKVFWLPDTFGYSAQLPQILKSFDIPYFLSQKLSWNLYNKYVNLDISCELIYEILNFRFCRFPHTSFVWEGIDGSSVIAHFPSADTYGAECTVAEMLKSVSNNKSK